MKNKYLPEADGERMTKDEHDILEPRKEREPMKVKAWIQMGCERREVTFDVTDEEMERVGEEGLEMYIEEAILDWISCRYGWGWSCDLITNDFSFMEDVESASLMVTNEVLNPRTLRSLVTPRKPPPSYWGDPGSSEKGQGAEELYRVRILAKTSVETTVAVMAESEEQATRMALHGVDGQPDKWVHDSPVHDLEVLNVSQETPYPIDGTYQTHLLDPRLDKLPIRFRGLGV